MAVVTKPKTDVVALLAALVVCISSALAFTGSAEAVEHSWECIRHSGHHCTDFGGMERWQTVSAGFDNPFIGHKWDTEICVGKKPDPDGGGGNIACGVAMRFGHYSFGDGRKAAFAYFVHPNVPNGAYLRCKAHTG